MLLMPEDPDLLIMATGTSPSPPSPPLYPEHSPAHENDNLDDVWGSSPSSPSLAGLHAPSVHHHPSDIPRLQQEHATAGYRDGITVAKAESAQKGFDEGFGLGAVIGSRVGLILGLLEGIAGAVPDDVDAQRLLAEARKELDVVGVFGRDYWDEEGIWKYEVKGEEGEEEEILFRHVAGAHPLVGKWEAVVRELEAKWGVDSTILEEEDGAGRRGEDVELRKEVKAMAKSKEVLEW